MRKTLDAVEVAKLAVMIGDVRDQIGYAADKHGVDNTPLSPALTGPEKLVVLVEEVGEVASALTYDERGTDAQKAAHLKHELAQVAAVCILWGASL